MNYFFLNHRRQRASFPDLFILFAALGLHQRKPQDPSSFTHWGRNSCTPFPAQAMKQSGGWGQTLQGYAAQWGDHPPIWEPTYSWGVTLLPSYAPTAWADGGGGGVRAGCSHDGNQEASYFWCRGQHQRAFLIVWPSSPSAPQEKWENRGGVKWRRKTKLRVFTRDPQ